MLNFSYGVAATGYVVAAVFFAKFWSRTRDTLFGWFASAFGLLALEQALLSWEGVPREEQTWVYLLRLGAFLLIIVAVARKNGRARTS
jgi:membrane-associated PAP2 superfamily phosphatase